MPDNIEIERSYLAAKIPDGTAEAERAEMEDIYFPAPNDNPDLRIRRNVDGFELTKKTMTRDGDASSQKEQNIALSEAEYRALARGDGKKIVKTRYCIPYKDLTAEIDIFEDRLAGLVLIEFEFDSQEALDAFEMPDFCLKDVTQEEFIAGGKLAGKTYDDIASELERFGYKALSL